MQKKKKGSQFISIVLCLFVLLFLPLDSLNSQQFTAQQHDKPDTLIDSLLTILNSHPHFSDSTRLKFQLAQSFFLLSFKPESNATEKESALKQSISWLNSSNQASSDLRANALMLRAKVQLLTHLNLEETSLSIDMLKRELEDLIKEYPLSAYYNAIYGELLLSLKQFNNIEKILCKYFFTPLPEKDYSETALLHLLQAKHLEPSPYIYYLLAKAYFAVGNHRDALLSIKSCLSFEPIQMYLDQYYQSKAKALRQAYSNNQNK